MTNIVRYIGDIHGNITQYEKLIKTSHPTVQVGDFGFGFIHSNPIDRDQWNKHRFIRGNHDCPATCREQGNFIPDGHIERVGDTLIGYVGGADSIDKAYRTEGVNWWADEQLTVAELNAIHDHFVMTAPEVIISHECPEFVAEAICERFQKRRYIDDNRTRAMLSSYYYNFVDGERPKLHIFGHWHHDFDWVFNGTRFVCLNELSYIDIDLDDLDNYERAAIVPYHSHKGWWNE